MIAQAWSETCSLEHDEPKNRDIPGERMCTDDVVRETVVLQMIQRLTRLAKN